MALSSRADTCVALFERDMQQEDEACGKGPTVSELWAWGNSEYSQTGFGPEAGMQLASPMQVETTSASLQAQRAVSAGSCSAVLDKVGQLWAVGLGPFGQLHQLTRLGAQCYNALEAGPFGFAARQVGL